MPLYTLWYVYTLATIHLIYLLFLLYASSPASVLLQTLLCVLSDIESNIFYYEIFLSLSSAWSLGNQMTHYTLRIQSFHNNSHSAIPYSTHCSFPSQTVPSDPF